MRKTAKEMQLKVSAYLDYGGTKKDFCALHGLKIHVLDYWRKKLSAKPPKEETNQFLALKIDQPAKMYAGGDCYRLYLPTGVWLELPASTPTSTLQLLLQKLSSDV